MVRDYNELERREARLIILKALSEQRDERLNSSMIRDILAIYGIDRPRDWVHEELKWMELMGVVVLHEISTIKVAQLAEKGARHLRRAESVEGISQPARPGV